MILKIAKIKPSAAEAADHQNYKGCYSVTRGLHVSCLLLSPLYFKFTTDTNLPTYVNIGSAGRCNDSTIFQKSSLARKMVPVPFF